MSKSVKHLVMLAMFTTMALTIFVVEAQIPIPVPISWDLPMSSR